MTTKKYVNPTLKALQKNLAEKLLVINKRINSHKNQVRNNVREADMHIINSKLAIIFSIGINLLLFFFVFIGSFFSNTNFHVPIQSTFFDGIAFFAKSVFTSYLIFKFCFWLFRKTWKIKKKRKFIFFGIIGFTMLLSLLFAKIMFLFMQTMPIDLQNRYMVINLVKDLIISLIAYLTTLFIVTYIYNKQILLENQKLAADNMRNRYEALKNQLNPHFLFNSLNTLDGLIGFDDENAHCYLQSLSSSFRYTIQNKEITTLEDELQFVESYNYLMKIRYGENLKIESAIDEKYYLYYIMPISLQLLIENAIKHNVINDKHPLTIYIKTTEKDTIVVSNAIQPKINTEIGEGIGLANLVERYHLLVGKEVTITQNGVFTVEIPLINKEI
jgi:sensor histidine kinase YesM